MRVIHILNHTERLSGNVHAAVDLACAQAKAGYCVAIVSKGGDFDDILRASGVEVLLLDVTRTLSSLIKAEAALLRLLQHWRPNIVHAHMMTSAILAFPVCQWLRIPLVTSVHNAFERSAIFMALGRRIIAVSAAVGRELERKGFPKSRLRVVLNGTIGSARFPAQAVFEASHQRPAILFVGGLHPRKGVIDLISAFAIVCRESPLGHLYIVGEGPAGKEYRAMASKHGLSDRVTFCGAKSDPRQSMRDADIFVLPSLFDPAPLVISEAREAGCAVIASDVDGIPEMLEHGQAGLLIPPNRSDLLAKAIMRLLDSKLLLEAWKRRSQVGIAKLSLSRVVEDVGRVYVDAQYDHSSFPIAVQAKPLLTGGNTSRLLLPSKPLK